VIRPEVWVVDGVSFPKCGRASAGVARQYCGALGKRANCQFAVSVHAATDTVSCPLEWKLFLPEEWARTRRSCGAGAAHPLRQRHRVDAEVGGHLLECHARAGVPRDPHDVLSELFRIRLRHSDILSNCLTSQVSSDATRSCSRPPDHKRVRSIRHHHACTAMKPADAAGFTWSTL
jgi:hypothetical protein